MFRRIHYCVFIIGAVLLLLAVVSFDSPTSQTPEHQVQRAYVAQAVSRLESACRTCHSSANTTPQFERVYALVEWSDRDLGGGQTPIYIPSNSPGNTVSLLPQERLNAQLVETGQRLLNLPQVRDQRAETVVEDFLHIYAVASAGPDYHAAQWAFWQLDGIESLLRILENQASPYRLARQDNPLTHNGAVHTLATAPGVALMMPNVSMGDVIQQNGVRLDTIPFAMPQEIVCTTHRRGPPAGVCLESVL
jgi:hypothetical protein